MNTAVWRVFRRAVLQVGRRGAFLAFLSALDILFGYSLFSVPRAAFAGVSTFLPVHAWAWAWVGVGCFCATGIPLHRDRVQFAAAAALKVSWGALYIALWIQHIPSAWISIVIWLGFAVIVVLVAGWPEAAPDVLRSPPEVPDAVRNLVEGDSA
jgi:hypothetical protein